MVPTVGDPKRGQPMTLRPRAPHAPPPSPQGAQHASSMPREQERAGGGGGWGALKIAVRRHPWKLRHGWKLRPFMAGSCAPSQPPACATPATAHPNPKPQPCWAARCVLIAFTCGGSSARRLVGAKARAGARAQGVARARSMRAPPRVSRAPCPAGCNQPCGCVAGYKCHRACGYKPRRQALRQIAQTASLRRQACGCIGACL